MNRFSLSDALTHGKLEEFVKQAENKDIGLTDRTQFDAMIKGITVPLEEDQTSHLSAGDCSQGK